MANYAVRFNLEWVYILEFELVFDGRSAASHQIDFYDVSQALWGFERVISLTNHLLLNGEVLTQSPSAKGFQLLAVPAEDGSWKWKVVLAVGTTIGAFGLAPPETTFGWLSRSAIDYVVKETLGFRPDFEKTLGAQIEEYREKAEKHEITNNLDQGRFDSLIEKTESGVRAVHRPIVFSRTADSARIFVNTRDERMQIGGRFSPESYEFVSRTITSDDFSEYCGVISSYNTNTYKGRIFMPDENRTIPFELAAEVRSTSNVRRIVNSLRSNAISNSRISHGPNHVEPDICFESLRNESTSGRLKSLFVVGVSSPDG